MGNEQWDELCAITTELFPRFGSRTEAFKQACRQRPDLAAAAIDPTGRSVTPGATAATKGAGGASAGKSAIVRACEELARGSAAVESALVAAAKESAARYDATKAAS